MEAARRAVFLDRDGTLIRNHHYGCDPRQIELLDGVLDGLRWLQAASYRLVVVTNQSGIARGYFDERQLVNMHRALADRLAAQGVNLDAVYYCPHYPTGSVPGYSGPCDCRKPRPGMLLRAARELRLDLPGSWLIGDILDDVEAGNRAGCRSVLVDVGTEGPPETALRRPAFVAPDFFAAARFILDATEPAIAEVGF